MGTGVLHRAKNKSTCLMSNVMRTTCTKLHACARNIVTEKSGSTTNTIVEARDVAPTITQVEEEAVATEEISAMPTTPGRPTPIP